eukprot:UN11275
MRLYIYTNNQKKSKAFVCICYRVSIPKNTNKNFFVITNLLLVRVKGTNHIKKFFIYISK